MNLFKLCLEKSEIDQKNENQGTHKSSGTGGTATTKEVAKPENTKAGGCPTRCPISEAKRPTTEETPQLNTEEEALIASFIDWVSHCRPGEQWEIPNSWRTDTDELRESADREVRKRNSELRVWREDKDKLACKAFFGPELRPIRKSQNSNRFCKSSTNRIETMWNLEDGWCRWDSTKQDYVPDPSLNLKEIEGASTRNQ